MHQAARHNDVCRDGLAVAAHLAPIMALTLVLPAALRRRRDIRQVDVELIPPDETPFVVQLLSTGELPGVAASPRPADDPDPNATGQPSPEAPQIEAVAQPELEPIPTPRPPDPPPEES